LGKGKSLPQSNEYGKERDVDKVVRVEDLVFSEFAAGIDARTKQNTFIE
jgi:hypothetical protein